MAMEMDNHQQEETGSTHQMALLPKMVHLKRTVKILRMLLKECHPLHRVWKSTGQFCTLAPTIHRSIRELFKSDVVQCSQFPVVSLAVCTGANECVQTGGAQQTDQF